MPITEVDTWLSESSGLSSSRTVSGFSPGSALILAIARISPLLRIALFWSLKVACCASLECASASSASMELTESISMLFELLESWKLTGCEYPLSRASGTLNSWPAETE
ncbi:hypothetical protein D3C78_1041580 [compost metagenome]